MVEKSSLYNSRRIVDTMVYDRYRMLGAQWSLFPIRLCCHTYTGVVFMRVRTRGTHLNGVHTCTSKVKTAHKGTSGSTVRIELWRARIRTGCYQVDGQTLAACILIKEAHFFQL